MKDTQRLAAIKALKPTPGPVSWDGYWLDNSEGQHVMSDGSACGEYCEDIDPSGDDSQLIIASFDPEYGLQALAAEVERLQERERPVRVARIGGTCVCGHYPKSDGYCPNCGRRLEWS